MNTTFQQHRLQASFTFRIVEAIKRIKMNPVSTTKGIPWGLSLATCAIVTIFSLNPTFSMFINAGKPSDSLLSIKSRVLNIGEIPVEIAKTSDIAFISASNDNNGNSQKPDEKNLSMAPKSEGGTWAKKADMPIGRECKIAVVDGKIYAIGGKMVSGKE